MSSLALAIAHFPATSQLVTQSSRHTTNVTGQLIAFMSRHTVNSSQVQGQTEGGGARGDGPQTMDKKLKLS